MTVRILHYADVENAYDTPERVGRLAGAIDALRDDPRRRSSPAAATTPLGRPSLQPARARKPRSSSTR